MFEQIKLYISNKWEKLYPLLFSSMICLLLYFFKDNEIIDKCYYKCFDKTFISAVSTQFRAYPFERALFSALNRVLLKN